MPQRLTLEVGADSAIHVFPGTVTQVRQSIVRVCRSLGISTEGTPEEIGQRLLAHIVDDLKRRAEGQSVRDLEAAQRVANTEQAKVENPL